MTDEVAKAYEKGNVLDNSCEYILNMEDIDKSFGGVVVLDKVCFNLRPGEVHALIGENGAGKSTLIKILMGILAPNGGKISIDGAETQVHSPQDAARLGISAIFQDLSQVPTLTVAENVFLGKEPVKWGIKTDKKKMLKESREIIEKYGIDLNPRTKVANLSMAYRQLAEIVKAIAITPRIIIMDEPTASLSTKEAEALYRIIDTLKENGVGIIYISHRMDEIFRLADRITVLRDGHSISTKAASEVTFDSVVSDMVGRSIANDEIENASKKRVFRDDACHVLEIKGLGDGKRFNNVSFYLKRGEILGFAGLVGSGRSELMHMIFGLSKFKSGELVIDGRSEKSMTIQKAMKLGIGMIPENRDLQGLVAIHNVRDNIGVTTLERITRFGVENKKKKTENAESYVKKLQIKTESVYKRLWQLSGGNRQKVVLAKWLLTEPKILILDEPTAGIDVQSKAEIHALMRSLTEQGVSIILISSEMHELLSNSDRILVMNAGRIISEYKEATQEQIMNDIMLDEMNRKRDEKDAS